MLEFDVSVPSSVREYVPFATSVEVEVELELELLPQPSAEPSTTNTIKRLRRSESSFLRDRIPNNRAPAIATLTGNILRENGVLSAPAAIFFRGVKNRTPLLRWLELVELQSDSEV